MKSWIYFEAVTTASVLFPFKMLETSCRRKRKIQLWIAEKRAREIIAEQEYDGVFYKVWETTKPKPTPKLGNRARQSKPGKTRARPTYTQLSFENISTW